MFTPIVAAGAAALLLSTAAAQITPYSQDFESLVSSSPTALEDDGWLIFANVFDASGGFLYNYGVFGAPNGGPGFSSLASSGNAGPAQGAQQMNVYSDYNNADHGNGRYIEANVFQERTIDASNVGETWTLRYDVQTAPPNNGTGDSTMIAFIKVLQSSNGSFALLAFPISDTTNASMTSFDCGQVSITIDPAWAGELLQFGFASTATAFNDTGRFYDNVRFEEGPPPTVANKHRLLYSNVAGAPSQEVPGATGLFFETGTTFAFDEVSAVRGDISAMAFTALIDSPNTTDDEVLIVNGSMRVREGDDPPFTVAGDAFGAFDTRVEVNSNGEFVFQNNTVGATTSDEMIVKGDLAGNLTLVAREGDPFAPLAGATTGSGLESANINEDGTVSYWADSVTDGGVTATTNRFAITGTSIVAQRGVTVLTGNSAGEFLDEIDLNDFIVSDNGLHWLARGDTTGSTSTDDCLIVNGEVVLRELEALPGGAPGEIIDTIGIFGHKINNSGDWIARGDLDMPVADDDWVSLNGTIVARTGAPTHAGSSLNWSPLIFGVELNDDGDFLIGGLSDSGDPLTEGLIVLNNERIVCREGDPVDVDGNGLFDDDAYMDFFDGDNMVLSNRSEGLIAILTSRIVDGAGVTIGQGIFSIELAGVVGSAVCNGEVNSTGEGARLVAIGSNAVADNTLALHVGGLPVGSMGYFVTSEETIFVANPGGSEGNLCIGSFIMGRYITNVLTADAAGNTVLCVDLSSVPAPMVNVAVAGGDTRYWQLWYRDTSMGGMATSNFSEAIGVTFE